MKKNERTINRSFRIPTYLFFYNTHFLLPFNNVGTKIALCFCRLNNTGKVPFSLLLSAILLPTSISYIPSLFNILLKYTTLITCSYKSIKRFHQVHKSTENYCQKSYVFSRSCSSTFHLYSNRYYTIFRMATREDEAKNSNNINGAWFNTMFIWTSI